MRLNDAYGLTESFFRWYCKSERHYVLITVAHIFLNTDELRPLLP